VRGGKTRDNRIPDTKEPVKSTNPKLGLVGRRRQALDVLRSELIYRGDSEKSHSELDLLFHNCERRTKGQMVGNEVERIDASKRKK